MVDAEQQLSRPAGLEDKLHVNRPFEVALNSCNNRI